MPKPTKFNNPVIIENYRGFKIRKYCTIKIRVNHFEAKKFIDMKIDSELSAREVLQISSKPCENCKGICVHSFNKKGEPVCVPRNILSNGRK